MNLPRKILLSAILALVLCMAVGWWVTHREPSYAGKSLTAYLKDLNPTPPQNASHQAAAQAIRAMGNDALPHLVKHLHWPTRYRLNIAITDFIERVTSFRFSVREPLTLQSVEAFRVLGDRGAAAIPSLVDLAKSGEGASEAIQSLAYIGPAAIPALTNLMYHTNAQVRSASIAAIGDMGVNGLPALPHIRRKLKTPCEEQGNAIRVLGEFQRDDPAIRSELIQLFWNTNHTFDAAFALGRMGELEFLRQAQTNSQREIRFAATAALDPQIIDIGPGRKNPAPDFRFLTLSCLYNVKVL